MVAIVDTPFLRHLTFSEMPLLPGTGESVEKNRARSGTEYRILILVLFIGDSFKGVRITELPAGYFSVVVGPLILTDCTPLAGIAQNLDPSLSRFISISQTKTPYKNNVLVKAGLVSQKLCSFSLHGLHHIKSLNS